jgi:hypothetical protein
MNPADKTSPRARVMPQTFKRSATPAREFTMAVAQLKKTASAPRDKRPVAPPVYRPQQLPKVLQTKQAVPRDDRAPRAATVAVNAPPVFRPPATTKTVQPEVASCALNRKPLVALPVYRPQAVPRVLQTKSSSGQSAHAGQAPRQPVAPPVYRPEAKKIVQPRAISQRRDAPAAPPAGVAQGKMPKPKAPANSRIEDRTSTIYAQSLQNHIQAPLRFRSNSVVQRAEQDPEESFEKAIRQCSYKKIKGGWQDSNIGEQLYTYVDKSQITWLQFACALGLDPPQLGHGTQATKEKPEEDSNKTKKAPKKSKQTGRGGTKQGGAKDEAAWKKFQDSMERIVTAIKPKYGGGTNLKTAEKFIKAHLEENDKPAGYPE